MHLDGHSVRFEPGTSVTLAGRTPVCTLTRTPRAYIACGTRAPRAVLRFHQSDGSSAFTHQSVASSTFTLRLAPNQRTALLATALCFTHLLENWLWR